MSHVTKYYISEVLEEVCQRLGGISEHVFPEHRPAAAGKQVDDFIVVSLPVSIEDQNAYQKTTLRIEIAVRNRSQGVAHTKKLQEMLDGVTGEFPIVTERFSAVRPLLVLKGDDGLGFTIWNIQAKLIVNTTDSYEQEN